MFVDLLTVVSICNQLFGLVVGCTAEEDERELVNCSHPLIELTACGKFSPNGCCAKGCVRNHRGLCVAERCTDSWSGWLERPVSMSCYFHWSMIIFGVTLAAVMLVLGVCNISHEVKRYIRQKRSNRFRRFSTTSTGSTQC
ncbi:hypothetical protein KR018_003623 [Drosophila ironensis]|nr:hypothetical protein KR018_003623 [Drosophila ironensis]